MKNKKVISMIMSVALACAAFAGCQFSPATNDLASDSSVSESPVELSDDSSETSQESQESSAESGVEEHSLAPWELSPPRDASGMIILTNEQKKELAELDKIDPNRNMRYRYFVILGMIDPNAPRLTLEDVKQILRDARELYGDVADNETWEYICARIGDIQVADYVPQSENYVIADYYLDSLTREDATEMIVRSNGGQVLYYAELDDNNKYEIKRVCYLYVPHNWRYADVTVDDVWFFNGEQEMWFTSEGKRIG